MHRRPLRIAGFHTAAIASLLIVSATFLMPSALGAEHGSASVQAVGDAAQNAKWLDGLKLAQTGAFDKAAPLVDGVLAAGVKDARVKKVDQWIHDVAKLQGERRERAGGDYKQYVDWVKQDIAGAKKDHRRGWWRLAMLDCARAYNCAADRDAVTKEPWFTEAVEGARKAAAEYEKDNKWLEAARIYGPLAEILYTSPEYRKSLERCQAYIRLELLFSEDAEWEATVKNIFPGMATDSFRKIEENYLVEPSFKEAAIEGLEQMLRLAHTKKLEKVFPALADKDKNEEFCDRINVRLQQVRRAESMDSEAIIDLFDRVLDINKEIDLLPQNVVIHEFVHGALQPLDPFSDMLWPADILEFNKHTQGRFSGVGIQIRKPPGDPIVVISPLDDTPAYRKGIQPNDQITEIDGSPTQKITINEAVRRITGPAGTTVTLTVKRAGVEKPFTVKLERQEITIFTIKGYERDASGRWDYMLDKDQKIGYVRMTNFTEGTIDELQEIIEKLVSEQHMRGLIFDLRGNPGGPLKAAVDVSDLFLDGSKKIVSTKDRQGQVWSKASTGEAKFSDFPMIILVDETTASASEIVSGALQVHHRALILGERSFGKGSVQQVLPLIKSSMAYLKLTTAHYYLPNGRCLHREEGATTWGVDPDVQVRLVPKEFIKMNRLRVRTDILKGKDQSKLTDDDLEAVTGYKPDAAKEHDDKGEDDAATSKPATEDPDDVDETKLTPPRKDDNNFPAIDPQLEVATAVMRIRLESGQPWPQPNEEIAAKQTGDTPAGESAAK